MADVVVGFYQDSVVKALECAAKDRVIKVQQAAHSALREWRRLRDAHEEVEGKKMVEEVKGGSDEELVKRRVSEKVAKKGRSSVAEERGEQARRKSPFLRKRMGTGGGYVEVGCSPQPKKTAPSLSHAELVKQFNAKKESPELATKEVVTDLEVQEEIQEEETFLKQTIRHEDPSAMKQTIKAEVSMTQAENSGSSATQEWLQALGSIKEGNSEAAFSSMLRCGISQGVSLEDDLYLLRLMLQTGPVCSSLRLSTNEGILQRINGVIRSRVLERTFVLWLQDAVSSKEFYKFSRDTQNELLDTLYEFSQAQSEFASAAESLYINIINSLNPY